MSQELSQLESWQTLALDILREAEVLGASSAEVDINTSKGFSVGSRFGEVETVEHNQDMGIEISVYIGKRSGSVSLNDKRWESIQSGIQAACNIARFTQEDPCSGLAEKAELAFNYPQINLSFPWDLSVDQAIDLACSCENQAIAFDKRIVNSEGVTVSTSDHWHLYANSEEFIGTHSATIHEISGILVAKQGDEMQRDYSYTRACDPKLLLSISELAREAAEKTINRLGARRLSTQKVPVIFIAEEARGLLGNFAAAIQGDKLYRKSSFLYEQLGKQIFPSSMRFEEKPFLEKGLGSAPFDSNGVATRNNVFIENGILQSYALGTYSARQLGMKTTGNADGMHNLIVSVGKHNLKELLKEMGKGLLVTELMGPGLNLVTGDYSRGATGFWVENGEIQYPVQEITIASNLRDMFARIVDIGNDIDIRGNIRTGSIWIEEMMVAGD